MRFQALRLSYPGETWRAANVRVPSELYDRAVHVIRENRVEGRYPDDMTSLMVRAMKNYLDQVDAERQSNPSSFSMTSW